MIGDLMEQARINKLRDDAVQSRRLANFYAMEARSAGSQALRDAAELAFLRAEQLEAEAREEAL